MTRDTVFEKQDPEIEMVPLPLRIQGEEMSSPPPHTATEQTRPATPPPAQGIAPSAVTRSPPPIDDNDVEDPVTEMEQTMQELKRSSRLAAKNRPNYTDMNRRRIQVQNRVNIMLFGKSTSKQLTEQDSETIEEALVRPEANEWQSAIEAELQQH